MTIFNCNIVNTFTSNDDIRKEHLEEFADNSKNLTHALGLNTILFSFYSTDKIDEVIRYKDELGSVKDITHLNMKYHYGDTQKWDNNTIIDLNKELKNKTDQMLNQIDEYEKNGINVDRVIYADDSEINQTIFKCCLKNMNKDIDFISLIPGSNMEGNNLDTFTSPKKGLDGLNECINQYINCLKELKR